MLPKIAGESLFASLKRRKSHPRHCNLLRRGLRIEPLEKRELLAGAVASIDLANITDLGHNDLTAAGVEQNYAEVQSPNAASSLSSAVPVGFTETVVASGLSSATAMQFSPDGKLFVAEQDGTMEVWSNSIRLQSNFFQNTPLATQTVSERGLLGVAFDPDYASNRFVYVYYTTTASDNHNRVSRFTANAAGDLALAGSEHIVIELDPHSAGNHNGGAMHFGLDGMLYIAVGDNAQASNSQSLANRHGKMLRIDVDGDDFPDAGQNFSIPANQPTTFDGVAGSTSGVNQSIWAIGLRNPFTFDVQPGTGRILINDVGHGTWEEINDGGAGLNYGWPATEGDFDPATYPDFARPFYAYDHDGAQPNGCAITGGAFYSPTTTQFPVEYHNDYFFADFCGDRIWHIDLTTKEVNEFASNLSAPVDLKVDDAGNLYYLTRGNGQVVRVSFDSQPTGDPAIAVTDNSGADDDAQVRFSTPLSQYRSGASDSFYVRPGFPDGAHYIDITNSGDAPLTLFEIQINAPDVTVDITLTSSAADDIVLAPGATQRVTLAYAPTLPTNSITQGHDFLLPDGLVILSDAANTPMMEVSLQGMSTFASDLTYDGSVNFGDLGVFNVNFGLNSQSPGWDPTADITGDGAVNFNDLGVFNVEFGLELESGENLTANESDTNSITKTSTPATSPATAESHDGVFVVRIESETALFVETEDTRVSDAAKLISPDDATPEIYQEPQPTLTGTETVFEDLGTSVETDSMIDLFDFDVGRLANMLALLQQSGSAAG